jgi:hypothetical protein
VQLSPEEFDALIVDGALASNAHAALAVVFAEPGQRESDEVKLLINVQMIKQV